MEEEVQEVDNIARRGNQMKNYFYLNPTTPSQEVESILIYVHLLAWFHVILLHIWRMMGLEELFGRLIELLIYS